MRAKILFFVGIIVSAGAAATPAVSEELIYSPWTKFCLNDTCFVARDARTASDCILRFWAALIERTGKTEKTLSVGVPPSVDQGRGVRIAIDQDQPIERPYGRCDANSCYAQIDGGAELIARLKRGRKLILDAVGTTGPMHFELPLADFAAAYDGPPQEPKVFKSQEEAEKERDEGKVWCDAN
jgi:invasion protein IalB